MYENPGGATALAPRCRPCRQTNKISDIFFTENTLNVKKIDYIFVYGSLGREDGCRCDRNT